jgi:aminoglycoside phosphotransferase (APT) family kinase protein
MRHRELAAQTCGGSSGLRIPDVVGADVENGLMAVEWLRGDSLLQTLQMRPAERVLADVVNALQCLHGARIPGLKRLQADDLNRRVREAVEDLAAASPELRERLLPLAREAEERLRRCEVGRQVTLHNDFHCDQFSIKREHYVLLDLERMALGDALIDVVNFATHLRMHARSPAATVAVEQADTWARIFLEHWVRNSGRSIDPGRYGVYAALSLLELARGAMRHFTDQWRALTATCVEQAERALSRSGEEAIVS